MATDPLAQNFSGQEGRGLAQVLHGDKTGETARGIYKQETDRTYKEYVSLKKSQAEALSTHDLILAGFDKDVRGELQQGKEDLRKEARELFKTRGVNTDTLMEVQDMKAALRRRVAMSENQQKLVRDVMKTLRNQTAHKYFDIEASLERIKEYSEMSIDERSQYEDELLVRRPPSVDDDPYVLPKQLTSPNYNSPEFEENTLEWLSGTQAGQEYWHSGVRSGAFTNSTQALDFVKRLNQLKYKQTTRNPSVKVSNFGEINVYSEAQAQLRQDANGMPARDVYDVGDVSMSRTAIVDIPSKKAESYGKTKFMDNNGNWYEEELPHFVANQYFYDENTGTSYLMGQREYTTKEGVDELTDGEIDYQLSLPKNTGFLMEYQHEGEPTIRKKFREKLEKEAKEVKKKQYILIPLTGSIKGQQSGMRPNIWKAHTNAFQYSQEDELERWFRELDSKMGGQTGTKNTGGTKNSKDLDPEIIDAL